MAAPELRKRVSVDISRSQQLFERERGAWAERPFEGVTWADFDQSRRLVFAKEGRLFAFRDARTCDMNEADELLDLNDATPTRLIAPASARKW